MPTVTYRPAEVLHWFGVGSRAAKQRAKKRGQAALANNDLLVGASPRAGLAMVASSKALAAIRGRSFVIPDDVKELSYPILRHRVILRPEAEIEGLNTDNVLRSIIEAQVVPR